MAKLAGEGVGSFAIITTTPNEVGGYFDGD
jgi:hypothetical protein